MALWKAVTLGMAAAIAIPFVLRGGTGWFQTALAAMRVEAGGVVLYWSWPLFCLVTLAAWGLLRAAER